jgi:hypothetical protein
MINEPSITYPGTAIYTRSSTHNPGADSHERQEQVCRAALALKTPGTACAIYAQHRSPCGMSITNQLRQCSESASRMSLVFREMDAFEDKR